MENTDVNPVEGRTINTEYRAISGRAQLGLLANLATHRIQTLINRQIEPLHLTHLQYHALYTLRQTDTWMRHRDLNQILKTANKRLRRALSELADRNLVDRVVPMGVCKLCSRSACYACTEVRISDLGEDMLKAAEALVEAVYRSLAATFTPSEYQNGMSFLRELAGLNIDAKLGYSHRVVTLTPRSHHRSNIRPAG